MGGNSGLQSVTEGMFTLRLITIIEELIQNWGVQNVSIPFEADLNATSSTNRIAVLTDNAFILFIFKKAFPGIPFPEDPDDPRVVAIRNAVENLKT